MFKSNIKILSFTLYYLITVSAWNPSNYPFIPACTDTSKVRQLIIEAQGINKKILDVGCGDGYSTSDCSGSLGIDNNIKSIKKAIKTFPNKNFKKEYLSNINKKYDVVTSMFHLHNIPRCKRKMLIKSATELAIERVVILDICPEYNKDKCAFFKNKPFINSYFETCREDLCDFTETPLTEGLLHLWILNKNNTEELEIPNVSSNSKVLNIVNWRDNTIKWNTCEHLHMI